MWSQYKILLWIAWIETCKSSREPLYRYFPTNSVADHAAIDRDQMAMEVELGKVSSSGFSNAVDIYKNGANSKAYAVLRLLSTLNETLPAGTVVSGKSEAGRTIDGTLMNPADAGATSIEVQYTTSEMSGEHVQCRVGASVTPVTEGCFESEGNLMIGTHGTNVQYEYNPRNDNRNNRTLAGFSQEAQEKMYECDNCPYPDFQKFYNYYGRSDYADRWITAAFDGGTTNFTNGNAIFGSVDMEGRAEAIRKATPFMSVWMYVIREMEHALDDCNAGCGVNFCNDDQVHPWDEAVAFYHGSFPDNSEGYLLFSLANKRCTNFGTCGDEGDETIGVAWVNIEVFDQFNEGKNNLINGRCTEAKANKERIVQLMTIPLIQGVLRYAWLRGVEGDTSDKAKGEGAAFAAAVLPIIHACSREGAEAAKRIHDNMGLGPNSTFPRYSDVKLDLEISYHCFGVTCRNIGGILDDSGNYFDGGEPCGLDDRLWSSAASSDLYTHGMLIGSVLSAGTAALLALW